MNRLTNKDCWKYEDFVFSYRNRETMQSGTDFAMYVKLKSLEDLEEELGINLITLFKALKGIWVKSTNGDAYYVGSPYLCFSENEKRELEFQFRVGGTWYKIKDRGKTWALDKEEFYKNIK